MENKCNSLNETDHLKFYIVLHGTVPTTVSFTPERYTSCWELFCSTLYRIVSRVVIIGRMLATVFMQYRCAVQYHNAKQGIIMKVSVV